MIKLDLKEKTYDKKIVLRDIFLTLYPKEILVINGASGIGKTTLLRIISGLDKDFSGTLENKFSSASISFAQKVFLGRLSAFKEIKVVTGADDNIIYQSMKELGLYQSK
ncbi:MAG: ATP-binding cassette domain-containing protein [Finegoldia sp.]|nr:ATP-binding cassette domain-containing protein [Finegoldia sp.]